MCSEFVHVSMYVGVCLYESFGMGVLSICGHVGVSLCKCIYADYVNICVAILRVCVSFCVLSV